MMMDKALLLAEAAGKAAARRKLSLIAEQLRDVLGSAAIEVKDSNVIVRGRGLLKRWLNDPTLRFLGGAFR